MRGPVRRQSKQYGKLVEKHLLLRFGQSQFATTIFYHQALLQKVGDTDLAGPELQSHQFEGLQVGRKLLLQQQDLLALFDQPEPG